MVRNQKGTTREDMTVSEAKMTNSCGRADGALDGGAGKQDPRQAGNLVARKAADALGDLAAIGDAYGVSANDQRLMLLFGMMAIKAVDGREPRTVYSCISRMLAMCMRHKLGEAHVEHLMDICLAVYECPKSRRRVILGSRAERAPDAPADPNVVTPAHPLWEEFAGRLDATIRAERCDGASLMLSARLLGGMAGIDVGKSLDFFRDHGGYCDCEVLFNV